MTSPDALTEEILPRSAVEEVLARSSADAPIVSCSADPRSKDPPCPCGCPHSVPESIGWI